MLFSACKKICPFVRFKVFLVIFLIVIVLPSSIFAQIPQKYPAPSGGEVNKALEVLPVGRFLPDSPFYFLITTKEFFSRLFQPSAAQRAEYDFILSGKRLKESYLMLQKGEGSLTIQYLLKYQKRLGIMIEQLKRARSQNQDIAQQIDKISDDLAHHQTLLLAIMTTGGQVKDSADLAKNGFLSVLAEVDKIKPGIGDRYKLLRTRDASQSTSSADLEASPTPSPFASAQTSTPSARPRRIIY